VIRAGQIVLFSFPQTDQIAGKLRPALVLRRLPGPYDDWLVCMLSSQLRHEVSGVDEVIHDTDSDFVDTGLKETSVIRVTRLAVVSADILQGAIGNLTEQRLALIHTRRGEWILGGSESAEEQQHKEPEQPAPSDP